MTKLRVPPDRFEPMNYQTFRLGLALGIAITRWVLLIIYFLHCSVPIQINMSIELPFALSNWWLYESKLPNIDAHLTIASIHQSHLASSSSASAPTWIIFLNKLARSRIFAFSADCSWSHFSLAASASTCTTGRNSALTTFLSSA